MVDAWATFFILAVAFGFVGFFIGMAIRNNGVLPLICAGIGAAVGLAIATLWHKKRTKHLKHSSRNSVTYNWNGYEEKNQGVV